MERSTWKTWDEDVYTVDKKEKTLFGSTLLQQPTPFRLEILVDDENQTDDQQRDVDIDGVMESETDHRDEDRGPDKQEHITHRLPHALQMLLIRIQPDFSVRVLPPQQEDEKDVYRVSGKQRVAARDPQPHADLGGF